MNLREDRPTPGTNRLLTTIIALKTRCLSGEIVCTSCMFGSNSVVRPGEMDCCFSATGLAALDINRFLGVYGTVQEICDKGLSIEEVMPKIEIPSTLAVEERPRARRIRPRRDEVAEAMERIS